jgi:hypothetical protein
MTAEKPGSRATPPPAATREGFIPLRKAELLAAPARLDRTWDDFYRFATERRRPMRHERAEAAAPHASSPSSP